MVVGNVEFSGRTIIGLRNLSMCSRYRNLGDGGERLGNEDNFWNNMANRRHSSQPLVVSKRTAHAGSVAVQCTVVTTIRV
jgi:hypothetical protein